MSDAVIFAISLGVTLVGLVASYGAYRARGAGAGLRGAAWSLVPVAAAMTGVTEFFVDLAFSPVKWAGVAVTGLAVLLYLTSGAMLSRRKAAVAEGGAAKAPKAARRSGGGSRGEVERAAPKPAGDPELAEIEKILRDRGIQ
ncbi:MULTISPECIES: hypothetical protein [Thermomonosporaceae]|uniref:hypothetical protein n=1 Tax=Thermomonosporaceae TaxID=2012 RepID=UPI00255A7EC1|nr:MULTISPECIES: hypothetical protein [Thermomonosporaceae]MDL4777035.1 hypothetical protein [Actinomadura xylanilytica]